MADDYKPINFISVESTSRGLPAVDINDRFQDRPSKGGEAILKLLLDKGADVNEQGELYGKALRVASSEGYEAIVKLLLDKGANPNAQGGYYRNALQAASRGGHEAVVKLLLDEVADPHVEERSLPVPD